MILQQIKKWNEATNTDFEKDTGFYQLTLPKNYLLFLDLLFNEHFESVNQTFKSGPKLDFKKFNSSQVGAVSKIC
jgi:hypothetical protein